MSESNATTQLPENAAAAKLQSLDIPGPAGILEALLNAGDADAPYSVLICHPHPPSGGTMHNKVVYHAMKAFSSLGLPVLRFKLSRHRPQRGCA